MTFSKINALFLSTAFFLLSPFQAFCNINPEPDSLKIFRQVAKNLSSLRALSYHATREISYPSENYYSKNEGDMYLNFDQRDQQFGFSYQYTYKEGFSIFNGAEIIDGSLLEKTISKKNNLSMASFESQSAVYNSIITVRGVLPLILSDINVPKRLDDTVVSGKAYHKLQFVLKNRFPNNLGSALITTTVDLTFIYKLIVDKDSLLPISFIRSSAGNADLIVTKFDHLILNPKPPTEISWYYSSYLKDYHPEKVVVINMIKNGSTAPDFVLKEHLNKETLKLSNYRGRLVLLEFWIKNCSYCIAAVPKLNALYKNHSPKSLQVISVNDGDSDSMIDVFVKKNSVQYPVLQDNNSAVTKNYGISSFPQVVLIDKAGTVIYAGDFDLEKINSLIENNA